jgi:hypothetical protein
MLFHFSSPFSFLFRVAEPLYKSTTETGSVKKLSAIIHYKKAGLFADGADFDPYQFERLGIGDGVVTAGK